MTIGSAASSAKYGPQAPIPISRSFRRNGRLPAILQVPTASTPRRHFPKTVLADDSPRGRILVVADHAPLVLDVQRILRDAGYRAIGPVESVEDAERLTRQRPVDGAVVDLQLKDEGAAAIADGLVRDGIPFVWLTDAPLSAIPRAHAFGPAVTKPFNSEDLIDALERALSSGHRARSFYPVPPPQEVWPRVFPQL